MLKKVAIWSMASSVGLITVGCATIDGMVADSRNFLGIQDDAQATEPLKPATQKAESVKVSTKKSADQTKTAKQIKTTKPVKVARTEEEEIKAIQANVDAVLAKKKADAEKKKAEKAAREASCTTLVERLKQEDRQYLGEELYANLKEANLTCTNIEKIKDTSIGGFIPVLEKCRTQTNLKKDDVKNYTSFLSVCRKIFDKDIENNFNLNIQNRQKALMDFLEKDGSLRGKFPNEDDRMVAIQSRYRKQLEQDRQWGEDFEKLINLQWKPFNGYVVDNESYSSNFVREFGKTGKLTLAERGRLNCQETSYPGILYCGKIQVDTVDEINVLESNLRWRLAAAGFPDTPRIPYAYIFKLENQKLSVRELNNGTYEVYNRNLRNVAIELEIDRVWWTANLSDLMK